MLCEAELRRRGETLREAELRRRERELSAVQGEATTRAGEKAKPAEAAEAAEPAEARRERERRDVEARIAQDGARLAHSAAAQASFWERNTVVSCTSMSTSRRFSTSPVRNNRADVHLKSEAGDRLTVAASMRDE